ncbi:hypothetical protein BU23DRAFT_485554 [Bimuria novae-zelandiae CBS 107.79]|uniref:C2H2-type domain-containing protein n=1 Tax=Bimuria novae-zelandiae CBS 107.79 TaxID=1447943 RepID=A0A6A5UPI0_9PLEO|nr:hypothetical protein BU23DRAFT_485554 [Bimuria novae-zelandiae CBS 107.79]
MTPRSPTKQPQPKTTTISRRLRNRAEQHLSVQPPELPQLRDLRARRAATLPSNRHTSAAFPALEAHLHDWNADLHNYPRSNTSHPAELGHPSLLLQEALDIANYHSPRDASSAVVSIPSDAPESYQVQPNSPADLLPSPLPSLSGSHTATEFDYPEPHHDSSLDLQDMSTLGFMMAPAPYGMEHHYGSPPNLESPSYPPISQPYTDAKSSTSASYAPTYSASPNMHAHHQSRRPTESSVMPPYPASSHPRSPYQQSMGPIRTSPTPMSYSGNSGEPSPMLSSAPQTYSYPAIQSNLPPASIGSNTSNYPPPPLYPPSSYGMNDYTPLPTTLYPAATSPTPYSSYEHSPNLAPHSTGPVSGPASTQNPANGPMPRILNSRPKPQCWEHGCNGRQFSTFSNLLRHQREKSGTAAKSYCPRCGAEFTRSTARNGHMQHEKCKPRRMSDSTR